MSHMGATHNPEELFRFCSPILLIDHDHAQLVGTFRQSSLIESN